MRKGNFSIVRNAPELLKMLVSRPCRTIYYSGPGGAKKKKKVLNPTGLQTVYSSISAILNQRVATLLGVTNTYNSKKSNPHFAHNLIAVVSVFFSTYKCYS